jgi:hypothetical protein
VGTNQTKREAQDPEEDQLQQAVVENSIADTCKIISSVAGRDPEHQSSKIA